MLTTHSRRELPRIVDARKLAGQSADLAGIFQQEHLPRLVGAVLALKTPVSAMLHFAVNPQGVRTVEGSAETTVEVTCQRCMAPMCLALQAEMALGMVWDDEDARHLSAELDPWLVADERANLCELVEDELLLALRAVNYHDERECQGLSHYSTGEVDEKRQPNPFKILEQLKGDSN